MTIIEEVHRKRENLARVLKDHPGIRSVVEELYPDSAHFIYELLQNAEDTDATVVQFTLSKTALVFEHNGRPFEQEDILAITDIGKSTKTKDDDKIGRFGIGFKAVFAYSESPHIWSPKFSFKITDLVLPIELEPINALDSKTRFEFPFNNPKKKSSIAYDEINAGLKELAETTLLFLSHLESIGWQNATGESGEVLRFRHSENHFEVLKQTGGKTTTSAHFLKFDQPVMGLEKKQRVAVAYALDFLPNMQEFDPKKALTKQLKIISATPGKVAVFFPAEKETSGLRFHLHAPFVPELSRASIKETDANLPLFQQLATLVAVSLHQVRELGLLTTDFLSVLPNPKDLIPTRYEDIRTAIVKEMNEQPLTPTYARTHAPAKHLLQAKESLKDLLSEDDIKFLIDYNEEPPQWASTRALQGTNIERFMTGLAITDWDIEQFVGLLSERASDDIELDTSEFMDWLSRKSVEWHQEFYAMLYSDYLSTSSAFCNIYRLKLLQIIRLSNNNYSVGPKSFFPSDGVEQDDGLPRVDIKTYTAGKKKGPQQSAKKFLEVIGVREVGEAEQVEAILKQRYTEIDFNPLKKDLKRFVALLEKEPDKADIFTPYFIFECQNDEWCTPYQIFLDQPFMDTGLSAYYDALGESAQSFALSDSYKDCGVGLKKLVKFAIAVGVQIGLQISQTNCSNNPDRRRLHSVGGNQTSTSIDRDYVIAGLEKILTTPSLPISKLIWQCMRSLPQRPDCLKAIYQNNQTTGYRDSDSTLVHQLRAAAWVPQGDSVFVRPAEATRELLPDGFQFDSGWPWLKAIQFGEEAVKKSEVYRQKQASAKELGWDSAEEADKWKKVRDSGVSPDEILAQQAQRQRISQPEDFVQDPIRRQEKILANTADAPSKASVTLERSIQKDISEVAAQAKAYLRSKYKNADEQLVCQCCHSEMPFKLPSDVHYFEAVQCIGDKKMRYFQNRLALCPNCAAMYQYARETTDAEIRRCIVENEADDQAPAVEIPIRLAGRELTLRFVGTHWFDLKTILSQ